jgi:peptidoglycan/LPS O-acetylase OafA/YrhL
LRATHRAIQLALGQPIGLLWLALSLVFAALTCFYFKRPIDRVEKAKSR